MLRPALIVTSIANAAAGVGLASMWYGFRHDDGMPIVVLFVALSLFIQGAFTLGHVGGLWKRWGTGSSRFVETRSTMSPLITHAGEC